MNCRDLRVVLRRGEVPSGAAVDAHLADCEACRELVQDEAALARALGDEADPTDEEITSMLTAVRQELAAETGPRAWLRSRATGVRLVISVAVLAAVAGFVAVASPRGDLAEMPKLRLIAAMTIYTGLAFASMRVALRPLSQPAAPEKLSRLLIVAGLATAVGFALAPMAHGIPITRLGMAYGPMVTACFLFGSVFAVPLLVLSWALDRGGYFIGSRLLLAGAAAGLAGNLFLELHCDIQLPAHLLMGHATVVVALLAVGLALSWGTRRR
jgi:predicted anti-sigma-YlaC factor YlaD